MGAQYRPVAPEMPPRERQQYQKRPDPPDAGQRHRRHMAGDISPKHDIAGPEQRGQAQEQIGLVIEPSERIACRRRWCGNRHRIVLVVPDSRDATSPTLAMLQFPDLIDSDRGERHGRGSTEYQRPQGAGASGTDRDGEPYAIP